MQTTTGKRRRKGTTTVRTTTRMVKPFRPPRRAARRDVIPGLLRTRGEEKKVLLTSNTTNGSAGLAMNSTGTIQCLNFIQVGSSMFNRIGRRVEMKSIRFTMEWNVINAARVCDMDYGRIIIVYDRQTNGAYPAITDVIQDTDQTGANTTTSLSGINMNNRDRFVVIMDKRIYLPQVTIAAPGVLTAAFAIDSTRFIGIVDEFRKLFNLTTHYKADSNPAGIGDISTGALYVISLGTNAAGADAWSVAWNARLKYVDV